MDAGEKWRFELQDARADRIFLVKERDGGFSSWIAMDQVKEGHWEAVTDLPPGHYRMRYFRAEGQTFFNAGSSGLVGERIAGDDPAVTLDSLRPLVAV
ncbi:hypothetical protein ACERK3_04930 [Phycisphaerales bacterium AB-hyl4]|uniref:Uncharacterized protein n=1 Tax=Natronomicrosphaera hydrolytica TaxID=3242702 RepID=A0ABV4U206_9BACT